MANVFDTLNDVDVKNHIEKKGRFNYVSWVWAWAEVKHRYPDSQVTVYENDVIGLPYFTDGRTAMVKVGMTVNGIEHIEWFPIKDQMNRSIPVDRITSMDINTSIQRATAKCAARHGLGLSVYAGEDTMEFGDDEQEEKTASKAEQKKSPSFHSTLPETPKESPAPFKQKCSAEGCNNLIDSPKAKLSEKYYGRAFCCKECLDKEAAKDPGLASLVRFREATKKG